MARRRRRKKNPLGTAAIAAIVAGVATLGVGTTYYVVRRRRKQQAAGGAKQLPPVQLPPEILAGGVPIEPPWHAVGWYTYPEGQFWIRVDEYGDPVFDSQSTLVDIRNAVITGRWRWTVIAGQATPLATGEIPQGTYQLGEGDWGVLPYTKQEARDEMAAMAAKAASEWIDTAYGLG